MSPCPYGAADIQTTPQRSDAVGQPAQTRTGHRIRPSATIIGDLDPELFARDPHRNLHPVGVGILRDVGQCF